MTFFFDDFLNFSKETEWNIRNFVYICAQKAKKWVICGGHEAKYWLEPRVELAKDTGIPEHKLNEIKKIVEKYADSFKEQFRQHIGKRIDD